MESTTKRRQREVCCLPRLRKCKITAVQTKPERREKADQRENSRIWQQNYRDRKRKHGEINQPNQIKRTRAGIENQRKIWREAKRNQRAIMSSQKRRRINEKRRKKYSEKKKLKEKNQKMSHLQLVTLSKGMKDMKMLQLLNLQALQLLQV